MILINSIDQDASTDEVIRWLLKMDYPFLRFNGRIDVEDISYNDRFRLTLNGNEVTTDELTAKWYRRGKMVMKIDQKLTGDVSFDENMEVQLIKEHQAILDLLNHYLREHVKGIGDGESCLNVNKNEILRQASKLGIHVPASLITSKKSDLVDFSNRYKQIITKSIHVNLSFSTDSHWFPTYTCDLSKEQIEELPQKFQPTLFQEKLDKRYEIRSFYLKGKFYSMVIFSQKDQQTSTDYRRYNYTKPNRTVPFQLPDYIESKLDALMKGLAFESGSIDIIYTKENDFYFLEVNPIGQFGMTSYPCNYHLEKLIAEELCQIAKMNE